MRKYSEGFERDWIFYYNNRKEFTFCGTQVPSFKAIQSDSGVSAKEAFFFIDSRGKTHLQQSQNC